METARAGTGGSGDNSARGAAVQRRIIAGQDGKLFNRVRSQIDAKRTPWRTVHVVIHADPVQTRVVLPRPAT